jgi:hypothetical protein
MMKVCTKCKLEKSFDEFSKDRTKKNGFKSYCKTCDYLKNKVYLNKNKDSVKERKKQYYLNNKEKILLQKKNNKEKVNEYIKLRKKTDPIFKLMYNIRNLFYMSLKRKNYTKKSRIYEILGCSFEEFKLHLESKFEDWMNWHNQGKYNGQLNFGWDIDHIIPLSSTKTEEEFIRLNHYTNLQPLCSKMNRDIKKDKF